MKIPKLISLSFLLFFIILGCSKEKSQNNFKIKLTDAPYDAEEVNVDIRKVVVNYTEDSVGWVDLNTNAGIYNLLDLQNNVQTLLATGSSNGGTIKELRLILGSENSIKINDVVYPLTIPSGSASGLKIKVNKKLSTSLDSVVVDFDAGLSVIKTGNNEYKLKPVLKIK